MKKDQELLFVIKITINDILSFKIAVLSVVFPHTKVYFTCILIEKWNEKDEETHNNNQCQIVDMHMNFTAEWLLTLHKQNNTKNCEKQRNHRKRNNFRSVFVVSGFNCFCFELLGSKVTSHKSYITYQMKLVGNEIKTGQIFVFVVFYANSIEFLIFRNFI